MRMLYAGLIAALCSAPALAESAPTPPVTDPDARAAATLAQMTPAERTVLTHGILAIPLLPPPGGMPADVVFGAGYVAGIPRLNVPALKESDASLGVAYVGGLRRDGATALPSGMAMGATWNPDLIQAGGAMIGGEASAKGFNVLLAGGANLMRDPRNGRTFEYLGEDPLLSGTLAGAAIAGIQSAHVLSTTKHFALNDQETGRHFADVKIADAAARESDLLAFEIAIERGLPGSVMCAYNQVGGHYACDNDYLLNRVLKRDWGYKGFVMSDWGAVPTLTAALDGLDQQSGSQIDPKVFLAQPLADAAAADSAYRARVDDMNQRILRAIYAVGLDANPPVVHPIDFAADGKVAQAVAEQGIVLLRNAGGVLPITATAKRILVVGGYADTGVLSGGGSSQVEGPGGAAAVVPLGGTGPFAALTGEAYQRSAPLSAIKAVATGADVRFRDGRYISDAVLAAKSADMVIVFATQGMTEGLDAPDLSLPRGQDALIAALAEVNPHIVVVLETGGPVVMPWLDRTAAVIEAWYPGARGGQAIANVLFGVVDPSGRLPGTFPASLAQLPRPELPGAATVEPNFEGRGVTGQTLAIDYDIEGSDIGYRWFARQAQTPLFPFGFGLSYTTFDHGDLKLTAGKTLTAAFTLANTGPRQGADVGQLYLVEAAGKPRLRLVGFQKVDLQPGEHRAVTLTIDPRLLADWTGAGWTVRPGVYQFALGRSATDLAPAVTVTLAGMKLKP